MKNTKNQNQNQNLNELFHLLEELDTFIESLKTSDSLELQNIILQIEDSLEELKGSAKEMVQLSNEVHI